jgi:two-component system CheB/CheR fusion protein
LECASGQPLDLLITDYHLRGGATGLDVVHAVRDQVRSDLPVIVVSGDTSNGVVGADLEEVTFLTKPVNADELLAVIRRQIETPCLLADRN